MRIGLMIGPEKGRYRQKVAQLVADAEAAERDGFTSIWVPQIPGDFDALTAITLMGPVGAIDDDLQSDTARLLSEKARSISATAGWVDPEGR